MRSCSPSARVEQAEPELRRQGIDVGLDLLTGTVVVRVHDLSDADARALSRRFGATPDLRPSR